MRINKLIKTKGRVNDLVIPSYLDSKVGLGHSRWATHGGVSEEKICAISLEKLPSLSAKILSDSIDTITVFNAIL